MIKELFKKLTSGAVIVGFSTTIDGWMNRCNEAWKDEQRFTSIN